MHFRSEKDIELYLSGKELFEQEEVVTIPKDAAYAYIKFKDHVETCPECLKVMKEFIQKNNYSKECSVFFPNDRSMKRYQIIDSLSINEVVLSDISVEEMINHFEAKEHVNNCEFCKNKLKSLNNNKSKKLVRKQNK